ncbi:unnamed protein product [Didymodactylos carnosus]|uniref:Uncharacterized protein n=1 Tax=Didymodactylos carnosus TaxID=1234261 RepID=A0A814G7A3_9BILA|nr:unnamed protein product [Didymodactylos carnosus]CAF1338265.1 unnamed protein product [Didymodactylos carnosus]CAF3766479.1 unnamed protein product [Didymodactylos carnosus]CAF4149552.1 unnamed protein product [Didymodactylos carnosus]
MPSTTRNYKIRPRDRQKVKRAHSLNRKHRISPSKVQLNLDDLETIPNKSNKRKYILGIGAGTCCCLAICAAAIIPAILLTQNNYNNNSQDASTSSINGNMTSTTASSGITSVTTLASSGITSVTTTAVTTTNAAGYSYVASIDLACQPYYCGDRLDISTTANLTNLTIIIIVQKTVGATYKTTTYDTAQSLIQQTNSDNGTTITYTWTLLPGMIFPINQSPLTVEAQFDLYGTSQNTTGDTFSIIAQGNGVTTMSTGHF